ncbi:MAG: hypothetical protein M3R63_23485 [Actinomycetota bacterium]|nr:hypothetical protein [Actinomycetota bacterium]
MASLTTSSVIRRRIPAAIGAILSVSAPFTALAPSTAAAPDSVVQARSWHPATVGGYSIGGVALRDCYHPSEQTPSQDCTYIKTVPSGTAVHVVCQRAGQSIYGNNAWDYVVYSGGEGYMSDYYVITGGDGFHPNIERC